MLENEIKFYNRGKPYFEFTNFAETPFNIGEIPQNLSLSPHLTGNWKTSEHLFQAAKFTDKNIIEKIRQASTAREVFDLANSGNGEYKKQIRKGWHNIKLDVMYWIVKQKFTQNDQLKSMLVNTGNKKIIEDSPTDKFWGIGDGSGQNNLGKILEKVRDELAASQSSNPQNPTPDSPNIAKITYQFQYEGEGRIIFDDSRAFMFASQDRKYELSISQKHPIFTNNPPQSGKEYKISWKKIDESKLTFSESDFIEIEEIKKQTPNQPDKNENDNNKLPKPNQPEENNPPTNNDNSNQENNGDSPSQNSDNSQSSESTIDIPSINTDKINNAETSEQAQQEAYQQIQKLLVKSKVKSSDLEPILWKNKSSWEKYLKGLKTNQEVIDFVRIMSEKIKAKHQARQNQKNNSSLNSNFPNKNKILAWSLGGGVLLAILVFSALVFHQKVITKRKRKKVK